MPATTRPVIYQHDGKDYEGVFVWDASRRGPQPVVLVHHGWEGMSDALVEFGRRVVDLGYAAFACDLFGKGVRGQTPQECEALMTPFMRDRGLLRERLLHQVEVVRALPEVDVDRVAAIGFCFGGLCVLDLARAGAPLKGVASFHGLFTPPGLPSTTPIKPKVIAFHGWDDPMVSPDHVTALGRELTEAGADWQLLAFGHTAHAFMAKGANLPAMGIVYNARSAGRAWAALTLFLAEALCVDLELDRQ